MGDIIGGEFFIPEETLNRKNQNTKYDFAFSSGRCALFAILNELEHVIGKRGGVLLPNFLCDSITNTVRDAGWKYSFYNVKENLHIDFTSLKSIKNYYAIVLINYFGMTKLDDDINQIKELVPELLIIEDDVQAYYEINTSIADYSFTSLRKWFPCPDGADILTTRGLNGNIELHDNNWAQYKLAGNILKNYCDYVDDDIALALLNKGEELLDNKYLSPCSEATKTIFSSLDLNEIADKRKKNAKILHEELLNLNIPHLYSEVSVPLFIPIFVENRDELRRAFFSEKIFTPKHWPRISNEINGKNSLYDTELSLICDQRYGVEEMLKQISVLKKFLKIG